MLSRFNGADIVVHNVGGSSAPSGGFITVTDELWQRTIDENLYPAVRLDRGGTVITNGVTTGADAAVNLLRVFVEQITIAGTIMCTLDEMNALIRFVINKGIRPEIGAVVPMKDAKAAFRAMIGGETRGKTVFTSWNQGQTTRRKAMPTKVLYETSARATGGRDGRAVTTDGSLDLKLTTPKELGGPGGDGIIQSSSSRPAMRRAS
jgi:NAD(P)-dependent dehydrogenase (short-subunit alcohol dehydrogenase family)